MIANRHQTVTKKPAVWRAFVSRWVTFLYRCAVKESNLQPTLSHASLVRRVVGFLTRRNTNGAVEQQPDYRESSTSDRNRTVIRKSAESASDTPAVPPPARTQNVHAKEFRGSSKAFYYDPDLTNPPVHIRLSKQAQFELEQAVRREVSSFAFRKWN